MSKNKTIIFVLYVTFIASTFLQGSSDDKGISLWFPILVSILFYFIYQGDFWAKKALVSIFLAVISMVIFIYIFVLFDSAMTMSVLPGFWVHMSVMLGICILLIHPKILKGHFR